MRRCTLAYFAPLFITLTGANLRNRFEFVGLGVVHAH
jgi:hypothetical protein